MNLTQLANLTTNQIDEHILLAVFAVPNIYYSIKYILFYIYQIYITKYILFYIIIIRVGIYPLLCRYIHAYMLSFILVTLLRINATWYSQLA